MRGLSLISVFAATFVTPAQAQQNETLPDQEMPPGSRIPVPVKVEKVSKENTEIRQIQWKFGQCVVKEHRDAAIRYLNDYPAPGGYDRERASLIKEVADPDCLIKAAHLDQVGGVQMTLPADTMRYALADVLVRGELPQAALTDLDRIPALRHPVFDEARFQPKPGEKLNKKKLDELAKERSQEMGRVYISQFGECVVRTDPAKTAALLRTDPTTPEENAAFQQLPPVLGKCLDAGRTLSLNKTIVRGTIAFNFYRLSKAPRSTLPLTATI